MLRSRKSVVVLFPAFLFAAWCFSANAELQPVGEVILANGPFIALQPGKSARSLTRGSELYQGDRLWTGPRTRAQVRFSDGAIMTLRPDTEFSVDEYEFDEKNGEQNKSLFTLIKGGFRTLTGLIAKLRPDSYKVKTSYAIVGVRGTTYETVIDSGLYVAAWQGTVSVQNQAKEILLGFGQEYNYARVTSPTSAPTGLLQTPSQLHESVDPGLQQALIDPTELRLVTGLPQNATDARLSSADLASLDRLGVASFATGFLRADASDGSTGTPLFFDTSQNLVLRRGTPAGTDTVTTLTIGGSPVSYGAWDGPTSAAQLQPDPTDASVITPVNSQVFWVTAFPAASLPPTGTVSYTNVIAFQGAGEAGAVNAVGLAANINFGTAAVDGTLSVQNGPRVSGFFDQWNVNFSGALNGASVNANVTSGTVTVNSTPLSGVTGTLGGILTGPPQASPPNAPQALAGAYDLRQGATNFVRGTVVAQ